VGQRVSVVVCTHTDRRLQLLQECLASLDSGVEAPHEVLVVVDANPGLHHRLSELLPSGIRLLASHGRGVSQARNTAVAAATGELVAFIDDDATAASDWLPAIARPFADPDIVAVGGRIVPRWEEPNRRLPPELYWVIGCTYAGHPSGPRSITRPIGCNMVARRRALDEIGGFPREFGPSGPGAKNHSNEEIALSIQLRARFGQESIRYAPDALVRHYVPVSRTTWRYLAQRCVAEGVSKADVRLRYGPAALGFDHAYARTTLLPAIWRYTRQSLVAWDPDTRAEARAMALVGTGGLVVTAAAFGGRLVTATARRLLTGGAGLLGGLMSGRPVNGPARRGFTARAANRAWAANPAGRVTRP
jgi:GT2 family glycosyltransferase